MDSTFFIANAYYQIKSDENITPADSDRYKELDILETETYENAKVLRKEMLLETQSRADEFMNRIIDLAKGQKFVEIPNFKPLRYSGGIESRKVLSKLEDMYRALDIQAEKLDEWREKLISLLSLPLVDQEDTELQGDEYETSTKQQDEIYVYVEALRALVADRHEDLTGQTNVLINNEMNFNLQQAIQGEGHAPELMKALLRTRSQLKLPETLGSIRGIITELRQMKATLRTAEERGNSRAAAEIAIINMAFENVQLESNKQGKAVVGLEKEIVLFKDTMNARLEVSLAIRLIGCPTCLTLLVTSITVSCKRYQTQSRHSRKN